MSQRAWLVYLGRRLIDTVFFAPDMTAEELRNQLIRRDGYSPNISVRPA